MKPDAIFMGEERAIANAYNPEIKERLDQRLNFLPGYYTADVLRGEKKPAELENVEYAFSTWGITPLTEAELKELMPRLKAVFYAAGTVQAFARPFMKRGVKMFSAWGANAVPVAEVTAAEVILANKGFFQTVHRGGAPEWNEHNAGAPYTGNYDADVGIIGAGMIGTLVIKALKKHRLNIFVFDPFMSDERAGELGVKKIAALPELFEKCRVVSNHLANNAETVGMINAACFDKMADNGVFINTGRGAQVVEADMIAALKNVKTRCAVLDVTFPEPPEKGSELYTLPNVFLTPHMAGSIGSEVQRMGEYMCEEFEALYEGRPLRYLVTEKMLETMA